MFASDLTHQSTYCRALGLINSVTSPSFAPFAKSLSLSSKRDESHPSPWDLQLQPLACTKEMRVPFGVKRRTDRESSVSERSRPIWVIQMRLFHDDHALDTSIENHSAIHRNVYFVFYAARRSDPQSNMTCGGRQHWRQRARPPPRQREPPGAWRRPCKSSHHAHVRKYVGEARFESKTKSDEVMDTNIRGGNYFRINSGKVKICVCVW